MSSQGPEVDITADIAELKKAYDTPTLDVAVYHTLNDFRSALVRVHKEDLVPDEKTVVNCPFGMFFLPSHNSADGEAHILVNTSGFEESFLRDELTHEFSNYVAWGRWSEMQQSQQIAQRKLDTLFELYPSRVGSVRGITEREEMERAENHPAAQVLTTFTTQSSYATWDAPASVPADFVTIEKGFEDRLIDRKMGKWRAWINGTPEEILTHQNFLILNFPYLAYASFHPSDSQLENLFELQLNEYLRGTGFSAIFRDPILEIKKALHEIRVPVEYHNFLSVLGRTNVIYLDLLSKIITEPDKLYWGILRDVVKDSFTES